MPQQISFAPYAQRIEVLKTIWAIDLENKFETMSAEDKMSAYPFIGGVCFGLCCKWLELSLNSPSTVGANRVKLLKSNPFVPPERKKESQAYFYQAVNAQSTFEKTEMIQGKKHVKLTPMDRYRRLLKRFGLDTDYPSKDQISWQFAQNFLKQTVNLIKPNSRSLIGIRDTDVGFSHAICCHHFDEKRHYLFDPNSGEYLFDLGENPAKSICELYRKFLSDKKYLDGYSPTEMDMVSIDDCAIFNITRCLETD
ncbi:YopT-type cysteine protease domain-containing protein [Roseixanthobacter pseudopolyaromaticivorans]|uniref:YopT-type cysteine protease domain-containing protein n=1 Tax=Xanthobacteraceae TaxID=335928 RepID=UPI00372BEB09